MCILPWTYIHPPWTYIYPIWTYIKSTLDLRLSHPGLSILNKVCKRLSLLGENSQNVFDQYIRQSINELGQNQFKCTLCDIRLTSNRNMWNHVESQHFPGTFTYSCHLCHKECKTRNALSTHVSRYHK